MRYSAEEVACGVTIGVLVCEIPWGSARRMACVGPFAAPFRSFTALAFGGFVAFSFPAFRVGFRGDFVLGPRRVGFCRRFRYLSVRFVTISVLGSGGEKCGGEKSGSQIARPRV